MSDDVEMVANARRRHGAAGAMLAAGMLGLDKVMGRPPKEIVPIVDEAPGEPGDIDTQGIALTVDGTATFVAPALPRTAAVVSPSRRRRRR